MKLLKKYFVSLALLCAMLLATVQVSHAASFSVSAGQSTVSVGRTVAFTITVPAGCKVWTYSVAYSANLTWESGDLDPMGFEGESRVNQLVFRANDTGTGTVWISKGSFSMDGNGNETPSGSASVSIVSASEPDDSEPDYTPSAPGKSGNNALSALTVSAGTLTPAFDPAVTEYTLSLPQGTEKLTLTATPSDSNATVQGDGELTLRAGENTLPLVVTAENGDTKTYTITAKVAQEPTLFFDYGGAKLGVVKDVEGVVPPTGFTAAEPISHGGDTLPIWVDASGKRTLVYLVDEQGAAGFYLYDKTEGILSPYLPLTLGGTTYIYTGIPADKAVVPGLTAGTVEVLSRTISGWHYEDETLKDFVVLYLMDGEGQYGYYNYDTVQGTLQRFDGAVYTDDGGQMLRLPMLYVYIAGGAAALLLILTIVFACVSGSRGKKLRQLRDGQAETEKEGSSPTEEEPIAEELLASEETTQPEETDTAEQPPEPAAEETEKTEQAQPEGRDETKEEVPEEKEEPASEKPGQAEPVREKPPTEADKSQAQEKTEASLEDTLRELPLDELLRDIRDL